MIKYNLGCGYDKKEGFINVDSDSRVNPDLVLNLSSDNWNKNLQKADYIQAFHLLEHLPNSESFLLNCKNLLKEGGVLKIRVPCCFNTNGFEDPTHIKYFTPETFKHYSQNKTYSHYNTQKECALHLTYTKLIFSSFWVEFKHNVVKYLFNYSLSLSFVQEIEVTYIKK